MWAPQIIYLNIDTKISKMAEFAKTGASPNIIKDVFLTEVDFRA